MSVWTKFTFNIRTLQMRYVVHILQALESTLKKFNQTVLLGQVVLCSFLSVTMPTHHKQEHVAITIVFYQQSKTLVKQFD